MTGGSLVCAYRNTSATTAPAGSPSRAERTPPRAPFTSATTPASRDLQSDRGHALRTDPVRRLLRHGNLHAVRRHQQGSPAARSECRLSTPAAMEPTLSAATANCRRRTSTSAIPRPHRQLHPVGRDQHRLYRSLSRLCAAGSTGTYSLSGTGQLSAASEYIGYNSAASASFQQSGGTNAASLPHHQQRRPVPTQRRHARGQRRALSTRASLAAATARPRWTPTALSISPAALGQTSPTCRSIWGPIHC